MASLNTKMYIWDSPNSEKDAVSLLQKYNILSDVGNTPTVTGSNCISENRSFGSVTLQLVINIREKEPNNWFEGSCIPLLTSVRFVCCWCKELTAVKYCEVQLNLADKTSYIRTIICRSFVFLTWKRKKKRKYVNRAAQWKYAKVCFRKVKIIWVEYCLNSRLLAVSVQ